MTGRLLLFHTASSMSVVGDILSDVVFKVPGVKLNWEARCIVVRGVPDTVTFALELGDVWEWYAAKRALELLNRDGWVLYRLEK